MKRKNALGFSKTNWNSIIKLNAINTKRSNGGLMIPTKQAKSMVSMLPDSFFNDSSEYIKNGVFDKDAYADNHRIIDVCCNSGVLLEICYNKFMMELSLANTSYFESNADVEDYILQELLFAFVLDIRLCKMLRERFYHSKDCVGNIFSYNIISGKGSDASLITILDNSIAFGDKVLKFDVVCGNPPYNNDMYLDFVLRGHELSSNYDLWITPAKWQAKLGERNDSFRELITPYISSLIFYKNPLDVFPDTPMCNDSLSIYLVDKIKHVDKTFIISGKSTLVKNWDIEDGFDINSDYRQIKMKVLSRSERLLDGSLFSPQKSYFTSKNFGEVDNGKIIEDLNSPYILKNAKRTFSISVKDLKHLDEIDAYKCYISGYLVDCPLVNILKPNEVSVRGDVLLGFGDSFTCESIKSYYQSRLIWYLIYGLNMGNLNTQAFKFVPDPCSFDKVYEDKPLDGYTPDTNGEYIDKDGVHHCSLYIKYKLTEDEINVIESVIRERK